MSKLLMAVKKTPPVDFSCYKTLVAGREFYELDASLQELLFEKVLEKWRGVVVGAVERGAHDCVFCVLYKFRQIPCMGCPLSADKDGQYNSAKRFCRNTPYIYFAGHYFKERPQCIPGNKRKVCCMESSYLARTMLGYLERFAALYRKKDKGGKDE